MKFQLPFVVLEVTPACNLSCRFCYNPWQRPGGGQAPDAGYRPARKVLRRLFRIAQVEQIAFSGGEPLLAERFLELVLFCRLKRKGVSLISNGSVGTKEDYRRLLELGVAPFQFPCHSWQAAEHDALTGVPGSWEKSMASLRLIRDLGGDAVPVIVLTDLNRDSLEGTLRLLSEEGFRRIMLNRFNPGGRGIREQETLLPSLSDLRQAFTLADQLAEELGLDISSNVCTPVCVLNPDHYPRIGFGACSATADGMPLTLDCSGNLRLCNHSPHVAGNIFQEQLRDILHSPYVRRWKESVPAACAHCPDYTRCLGGCRAAAEQLGGQVEDADPLLELYSIFPCREPNPQR